MQLVNDNYRYGGMVVLSLGWGVQSFTLAAMCALKELPMVEAAIHADTTHEMSATYDFISRWSPWLKDRGVNVVTVKDEEAAKLTWMIPSFTPTGMGRRYCTSRWKITPVRRYVHDHRKYRRVEMWIGISTDELLRAKPSGLQYLTHRFPLLEGRFSRSDCISWLQSHSLEVPPRSSCYFCPYHSKASWEDVRNSADWTKAVAFDNAIRNSKTRPQYLHASLKPLSDVFSSPSPDLSQDECSGYCFM